LLLRRLCRPLLLCLLPYLSIPGCIIVNSLHRICRDAHDRRNRLCSSRRRLSRIFSIVFFTHCVSNFLVANKISFKV